jgi:hypothetical protein
VANFRQALTPPLAVSTAVSASAVAVGQSVVGSVSLDNAGTATGAVDMYLGLLLPGGDAVFFTSPTITETSGYAFGKILDYASYRPVATAVPLGTAFTTNTPNFFSYQRKSSDPAGGLTFFLLAVTAGALDDGVLAPGELLAVSLSPFTFPAPAADEGACAGADCPPQP